MKLLIGRTQLEILGDANLVYDGDTDTLSINASDDAPARAVRLAPAKPKLKPGPKQQQLLLTHEEGASSSGLTKTTLTNKVMKQLEGANAPVALQSLTMSCLGKGSPAKDKTYLKLLLERLAAEGKILESLSDGNRRQYALAA